MNVFFRIWLGATMLCVIALSALTVPATAVPRTVDIAPRGMRVRIGQQTGRVTDLQNLLTRESYPVREDRCVIETDAGPIDLSKVAFAITSRTANSCRFAGESLGLEITRGYTFTSGRAYFDRTLSVRNSSGTDVVVRKVTDCALVFEKPFASAAFHDDNMDTMDPGTEVFTLSDKPSLYHSSINVFLRSPKGGLVVGLKYPYWRPEIDGSHVCLAYETNYRLRPGETLDLPTAYVGVYKKTGYTCRKELHWKPRIITATQEEMDWGEVRAMQQILRDYLPMEPSSWNGYHIWLNAWWAKRGLQAKMDEKMSAAYCTLADEAKKSKVVDMLLIAPVWCGWAEFMDYCTVLDEIGDDAQFPPNPPIERFVAYAQLVGLPLFGFCEPNSIARHYRKDRQDWKMQLTQDETKTIMHNCHANPAYEDWFYRLTCSAIDTYKLAGWAWDHCWIRRPMICYSKHHGHEPGNCEFQQYRNVTGLIQRLRARYPKLFLEVYWGLKEAGPWGLKGLNSLENAYENGSPPPPDMSFADDLRFQHWYNHNYRFIPTYMNLAQINFAKEKNGHLYSLLSCMSSGSHGSLADWVSFQSDKEADAAFALLRKWKAWANRNHAYLTDRIDLFGQPCRRGGIDGTAHIIKDRGFIFVFNPWPTTKWGSVPLGDMIGLNGGGRYSVDEISTGSRRRLGVYEGGSELVFSIPAKSAMLMELRPTQDAASATKVPFGAEAQPAFVR